MAEALRRLCALCALRHTYNQVDPARIWEIATGDLPRMAAAAEAVLQRLDTASES